MHLILEMFILYAMELGIPIAKNKAKSTKELADIATASIQASKHKSKELT